MKIGLWGFYGFGNLGDEAIQNAVISNIRLRIPDAEITAICLDPKRVSSQLGIAAYPIYEGEVCLAPRAGEANPGAPAPGPAIARAEPPNDGSKATTLQRLKGLPLLGRLLHRAWRAREQARFLRRIHRFVSDLDVLIISGSGVLDDGWRGRWMRPFALYRWCLLARISGTRLVFLSVGATSLTTRLGQFFGKQALQLAEYRSFRDRQSHDLARRLRVKGEDPVMPDLAFSLDVTRYLNQPSTRPVIVGLGAIPYCDPRVWPEKSAAIYNDYIEKLARLAEWLLAQGYVVRFIVGEMRVDAMAAEDVRHALASHCNSAVSLPPPAISSVDGLMSTFAEMDYVVTSRFHGVLLPYLLGRPVLALSYNSKFANLMRDAGQEQYCLDIRHFDVASCMKAFESMVANKEAISAALSAYNASHRETLKSQYDLIFPSAAARAR